MARVEPSKEKREASLHGDVLEEIISHVPTLHLVPSSHVSKSWRRAVSSSFRRSPRLKPWLVLHLTCRGNPFASSTHAYDPHSRAWIPIPHVPSSPRTCPLRSSHPRLLFTLSLSKLSLSSDPFAATWLDLEPPRVCRRDPVVALVGHRVVVAGGTCDFEGDKCAVESYDLASASAGGGWKACEPLPEAFRESASSTWLSVAASDRRMYVMEKRSGRLSSLDPETGRWSRTCEIRPDPDVFLSAVDFSGDRLIVAGVAGEGGNPERITIWEVDQLTLGLKEIGRMPAEMVERIASEESGMTAIGFSIEGEIGYLYNPTEMREAFLWEIGEGRWESIGRPKAVDDNPMARIVFGCSTVKMDDLRKVYRSAV